MQIYGRFPCKIQLLYWFPVLLARLVGVYCRWMLMNLGKNLREVHLNVKMWVLLFVDMPTVLLTIGQSTRGMSNMVD